MAVLTAKARRQMPSKDFVFPGKGKGPEGKGAGSYPIKDIEHGRKALQLGARHASPAKLAAIKAKVHRKFPSIKIGGKTAPLSAALKAKAA